MRLAAIDIGSNAMRLLISEVRTAKGTDEMKKLTLVRVPLRLGETVFQTGVVSPAKSAMLIKSLLAYKMLMEVYDVRVFRACATSAMREARNQEAVLRQVFDATGIEIEVIEGKEEAQLIRSTYATQGLDVKEDYLYIDVGGGSTELSFVKHGVPRRSKSFPVGTVRMLNDRVKSGVWNNMGQWLRENTKGNKHLVAIGSGGNINKLVKLAPNTNGRARNMSTTDLQLVTRELAELSLEQRIEVYDLKRDRADVIVPAGQIYLHVLREAGIDNILVPKIGLSDGIIYDLYLRSQVIQTEL